MTNQLQIFDFNGYDVRVVDRNGDFWFIAKDTCDILGLDNVSEAVKSLDDDERSNISNSDVGQSGGRDPIIISESGLYSLILRSRKPEAKEFKRWITHEVLPTIRKTGSYSLGQGFPGTIFYRIAGNAVEVPTDRDCTVSISKTGAITVKYFAPKPITTKRSSGRPAKARLVGKEAVRTSRNDMPVDPMAKLWENPPYIIR